MADNKLYITQSLENGAVMISEDVIANIVTHAACEVDGVVGINSKPASDIADLIGKKNWNKGIKITMNDGNSVVIDCNIVVNYGQNVVTIARAAQTSITNALESMAGIQVGGVNVNVCGITRQ